MTFKPWSRRTDRLALLAAAAAAALAGGALQAERPVAARLTREAAEARAARVDDVGYRLELEIGAEAPEFAGRVETTFTLRDARADLTVDFANGNISLVVLNGTRLEPDYNGDYLTLPASALQEGANTLEIEFSHPYSTVGSGLYRMRDPEDDRVYLYTDFEPYDQNRLFPSFDQPDLKATFASEITAPADWTVISVVRESSVRDAGAERVWTFPESPPISTYVYALHAGEYREWSSMAGDIPLRLFARRSLAQYVEPDDWFEFTRQGFAFYQRYFGVPYAFGKYDQIIVPHFNAGAMENVGAVTFSERYVRRGTYTRRNRQSIASVILHEMAHMWFGDLVTMRWWNGIWLNESFATFMSNLALVEATEFSEARESAYRSKIAAYRADERETTHPIDLPTPDTDAAFANFDSITYNKGSAVLAQLNHLVGPDSFRAGVERYLEAHAHGNTGLDDFLGAVSQAADTDLTGWAENWLGTPGANSLDAELECSGGTLAELRLAQSAPSQWPVLRTHRTQIGLYDFTDAGVAVRTVPATYSGALTIVDVPADTPCPDLVYPNHGDWDYVRVRLDPGQLPVLEARLNDFDDALTRSMLWQGVWDMALEARIDLQRYIDFALTSAGAEPDDAVLRQVLGNLQSALDYLTRLDDESGLLESVAPRVEGFLWQELRRSEPGSDRQLMLFDRFVAAATSEPALDQIAALYEGRIAPPEGLELDEDRRWNMVEVLSEHGREKAAQWIQAERLRDESDLGRLRALEAAAAAPDPDAKRERLARLFMPGNGLTLAQARAIADGLFPVSQHALLAEFTQRILEGLETLSAERDSQYVAEVAEGLIRPVCRRSYLRAIDAALETGTWMPPTLEHQLRDNRFESARCIAIGAALEPRD